ncbi:TetR/AcrR family transcriptional regulator [Catenuloplanes atrovinosus]|uniref:AcrR family transcriptional regulator n=1 Tax=Catenuloplanes atrovinosus TaxID=137266 RepID=A0AAE3YTX7_9ACTN|nr:TetR/AcrR family transcriptional regulator [Catenuloplanes atrovinosus]MDR7279560.1 AcrR family transcriptional regulator [Catenuloplanes atrovinosus]
MTAPAAPARERLDPEKIVVSALAIADAEGLAAVTIRRLAQEHGVTPMALYRHFRDKDELLHALGDHVLRTVALPAPSGEPWHVQLRAIFAALLDALAAHPVVAPLIVPRILASAGGLALAERALDLLAEAGFDTDRAATVGTQALCTVITLIPYDPAVRTIQDDELREERIRAKRAALATLSPRRYPRVTAAADPLTGCVVKENFLELGLDLVIAGLRGLAPNP